MADLINLSGFDPIFFLHHCNVDRMLSLWSAVNPGVWVSKGPAEGGTFTITANASVDASTGMLNDRSSYIVSCIHGGPSPHAILGVTDGVLGFIANYGDRKAPVLVP
jgi:hypothetical protein